VLTDESISRIDLLYNVARLNDSVLSLRDLQVLLNSETSLSELEDAFADTPILKSKYNLQSGFVFEKGKDDAIVALELQKRRKAFGNVALGARLAARLKGKGSVIIAIGGSTSYQSVKESDDLDFFCITHTDSVWIFLTKALLLLRATRLYSSQPSGACLSCVMDQDFAEKLFGNEQDPLFARDALNAIVLEGDKQYRSLLLKADWIARMFPRLYAARSIPIEGAIHRRDSSVIRRVVNLFLFRTVGVYIRMKSMLENRRIARHGNKGRLFVTRVGRDHCIYESMRYRKMREIYRRLG
jgi:hypothetical protein